MELAANPPLTLNLPIPLTIFSYQGNRRPRWILHEAGGTSIWVPAQPDKPTPKIEEAFRENRPRDYDESPRLAVELSDNLATHPENRRYSRQSLPG